MQFTLSARKYPSQPTSLAAQRLEAIIASEGPIPFKEYMREALYGPDGYYTTRVNIAPNAQGDFHTMPEQIADYGGRLAEFFAAQSELLSGSNLQIVEYGAGNGVLAKQFLDHLRSTHPHAYDRITYTIVEISPRLHEIQASLLRNHHVRHVTASAVTHQESVSEGLVLSNELPDAFPVDMVMLGWDNQFYQLYVAFNDGEFEAEFLPATPENIAFVNAHFTGMRMSDLDTVDLKKYGVPVNFAMMDWYRGACQSVEKGLVLSTDYGLFPGHIHHRKRWSLRVFGQQVPHCEDPLSYPGKIDITTDVHFGILESIGLQEGYRTDWMEEESKLLNRFGAECIPRQKQITMIQSRGIDEPLILESDSSSQLL